jgi:hypothetical protein
MKDDHPIGPPKVVDHALLIQMLVNELPEVPRAFDGFGKGLLHCEMGIFAGLTYEVIWTGDHQRVANHFDFVARVWERASPEVENAIDMSYVEYFALDEFTHRLYQALKRMPPSLRQVLLEIDGRCRWK